MTVTVALSTALALIFGALPLQEAESAMSSKKARSIEVFLTAKGTPHRLATQRRVPLTPESRRTAARACGVVSVDPSKTYQTIEGFGGAFTEAGAYTLSRVSPEIRSEALRAYFDPESGIGYTLCRTHINSCDFSLGNYSYDDVAGDVELEHFDISRDKRWLIPMIKSAMAVKGADFRILASPWSPPAWMKTNGQMNRLAQIR